MAASPRGRRRGGFPLVTFFIRPNSVKKPKGKPGSCTARSLKHTRPTCMETWQELSNYNNSWNFKPSEGAQFSWMHHMAWGSADRYTEVFTPLFVFYVAIQDHARDLADFHFLEIIKAYFFLWLWIKYQWLLFFFQNTMDFNWGCWFCIRFYCYVLDLITWLWKDFLQMCRFWYLAYPQNIFHGEGNQNLMNFCL
jgi:hypothetical protein